MADSIDAPENEDQPQQVDPAEVALQNKRTYAGAAVGGVSILGAILITVLIPIGSAVWFSFLLAATAFGFYSLYVAYLKRPASFASFLGLMVFVAIAGAVTYFGTGLAGVGANSGHQKTKATCDLYYQTLEDNAAGRLSKSTFESQLLEIAELGSKSDDLDVKLGSKTPLDGFLHQACEGADL